MNRRSFIKGVFAAGAVPVAAGSTPANAEAVVVRVHRPVRHWINRHRRYVYHHLARRRVVVVR
jgi:hypothetical protein